MAATAFLLTTQNNNQVIITLLTAAGGRPTTLGSDQQFSVAPAFGAFTTPTNPVPSSPIIVTIPAMATQGIATYVQTSSVYQTSATCLTTVTPGTGPLSALDPQECLVTIDPGSVVVTSMCAPGLTRPILRDEIRAILSVTPPSYTIPGAVAGEEPVGQAWPSDPLLNQMISDAIQMLNSECEYFTVTNLTIPVTAQTAFGPQWISLAGVGGTSPTQNVINSVLRISWDNGNGNPLLLRPQSWRSNDNQQLYQFNNYAPATPCYYITEGYQIGLLPAASQNGTLDMWAGVGVVDFCSDTDTLNQLPINYQPTIKYAAVWLTNATNPSRKDAQQQIDIYSKLYQRGLDGINKWYSNLPQMQQTELTFKSRRVQRWV